MSNLSSMTSARNQETDDASDALSVLNSVFGLPAFRGAQEEIVRHVTEGGNCLVLMPTGGGKSLCYQLPSLLREGCGIVVSPLIALMRDQVAGLLEAGVKAAVLNSTLSFTEASAVEARLIAGDLDLLYIAPERLLTPRCLALLDRAKIALFAIDEAPPMSSPARRSSSGFPLPARRVLSRVSIARISDMRSSTSTTRRHSSKLSSPNAIQATPASSTACRAPKWKIPPPR